jgi:hypothetical protein
MTVTIINLTSEERHRLESGGHLGYISFYSSRDQPMKQRLLDRGLIEPVANSTLRAAVTSLGRDALAYIDARRTDELLIWNHLEPIVEDLKKARPTSGSSREPGEYIHHEDGHIEGSTYLTTFNSDGTQTHHRITGVFRDGLVTTSVEATENTRDSVWEAGGEMDSDDDVPRRIIVNHIVYYIRPDTTAPSYCAGFGGRRWEIEYLDDGRRVVSRNLWQTKRVPPKWRDRWPDTARFIPEPPRPSLADRLGLKPVQ